MRRVPEPGAFDPALSQTTHMPFFESRPADTLGFEEVLYEKKEYVAKITINRASAYNAYSTPALRELAAAFQDASFDDKIGVIVFTGAGDRSFCTGGDVKEYEREYTSRPGDYWKYMGLFSAYIQSILNTGKPVIARINGMAVGGGNESQLACDLAIMAEHAYLAQVGTNVGSVACGGATQWLPLVVGDRRAREILMLNEKILSRKALDWGLVNRVVPSVTRGGEFIEGATQDEIVKARNTEDSYAIDLSKLDEAVAEMCTKLLGKFPECTRYTKQQVNVHKENVWYQTIGHARDWLATHYTSMEPNEGMRAFVEKRRPDVAGIRARAAAGESVEFMWGPYRSDCAACGAKALPEKFKYCGDCGAEL